MQRINPGSGYSHYSGPDGASFDIFPVGKTVVQYPFKVIVKKNVGTFEVYVRPGTANNMMAKIGSDDLDKADPPKLTFTTVGSSNKKIVALKVTYSTATFFPDASEIVLLDEQTELAPTNTNGYLQLASIACEVKSGVTTLKQVNQFIYASQVVVRAKPGSGTAVWSFLSR